MLGVSVLGFSPSPPTAPFTSQPSQKPPFRWSGQPESVTVTVPTSKKVAPTPEEDGQRGSAEEEGEDKEVKLPGCKMMESKQRVGSGWEPPRVLVSFEVSGLHWMGSCLSGQVISGRLEQAFLSDRLEFQVHTQKLRRQTCLEESSKAICWC